MSDAETVRAARIAALYRQQRRRTAEAEAQRDAMAEALERWESATDGCAVCKYRFDNPQETTP